MPPSLAKLTVSHFCSFACSLHFSTFDFFDASVLLLKIMEFASLVRIVIAALLWGCTNPFIARGSTSALRAAPPAASTSAADLGSQSAAARSSVRQNLPLSHYLQVWRSVGVAVRSVLTTTVTLFTHLPYVAPFILNQLGSGMFYWALSGAELSQVVPLTNALTFVITYVTELALGSRASAQTVLGCALIVVGVTICALANHHTTAGAA